MSPLVLASLLLPPFGADGSPAALALTALAWPIFVAGAVLRFWSTLYIGGRKRSEVVADGPYSVCRNPLYLGTCLIALSAALFLRSPLLVVGAALLALSYRLATIPVEERFLSDALGQPYDDYSGRVPRCWPEWRRFHTARRVEVDLRALCRECRQAAWWMWIPALSELIAHLRLQSWWARLLHLP